MEIPVIALMVDPSQQMWLSMNWFMCDTHMKRDDMFRCPMCKKLFPDDQCTRNPDTGVYICPNQCVPSFNQPPYEPPTID